MDATLDRKLAPGFASLPNAARYLGVSDDTIRRRVAEGKLTPYRVGGTGRMFFKIADLDALMVPVAS